MISLPYHLRFTLTRGAQQKGSDMADLFGHVSVKVLDSLGVTISVPYYFNFDDASALTDLQTYIDGFLPDLDAVTDGQIVSTEIVLGMVLPGGLKSAPVASSEVEKGGLFNFSQVGSPYKFGSLVPAMKATLIVNGKINLTAAAVTTWLANFTAVGGTASAVSTAIRALGVLKDALVVFRKHRKAESRRSFEVA